MAGAVAWATLLVAGQAATLQWVQAGPTVSYQHYYSLANLLTAAPPWTLVVVLVQMVGVVAVLLRQPSRLAPLFRLTDGGWRLGLAGLLFFLTSATLSRAPLSYLGELGLATGIQLLHLVTVLILVTSFPEQPLARFGSLMDRVFGTRTPGAGPPEPGGPDRFAWVVACLVVVVAAALSVWSYQRHPHVPDEVVYLLQARYLAEGHLTLPLPPVPEAFNLNLMLEHAGRWFSSIPPGWPFILSIGAWLGTPWLVNPLLGGVNVLLAYALLRELYPRRTARLAVVLLAASPWHLFMAMNLMTHTASLCATLGAALAVARLRRQPGLVPAVVAGICIGIVGLIRPLEGIAVALFLGVWSLGARGRWFRFAPSAVMTVTTALTSALVFPYNTALMGSPNKFPVMAYTDAMFGPGTNALGFGPNRGLGWGGLDPRPGHDALDVLINANFNLFQLNIELLGWASGSLVLLLLLLPLRAKLHRADWGMLAAVGMIVGLHSFYYFSGGPDFGARYWYLTIVPLVVLAARGLEELESRAATGRSLEAVSVQAAVTTLALVALMLFVPWRATDKYFRYRGMRPDLRAVAASPDMAGSILLIRGRWHPDYSSAATYNPVDLTGPEPIFAWDRGAQVRQALVAAYPGRRFFVVLGPSVTQGEFSITAGPMTAEELLARADTVPPPP